VTKHYDVIIVGAGISGVCAAYHLQRTLPGKSFVILEAREAIGGTWDLFRYPGVRSDSDMYTLGFPWRPWPRSKLIADGASIREYVEDSARAYGIDAKIRFGERVKKLSWSSERSLWTLDCQTSQGPEQYSCGFVMMCSGYYAYASGYTPYFQGVNDFEGRVVHPQFWSDDIDYANKRVVVIGSGATAVTLVPALAEEAAHVTMLQRSPSYVFSAPAEDPIASLLQRHFSAQTAYRVGRWLSIAANAGFYKLSRLSPKLANRVLLDGVRDALGPSYDVAKHFTPRYNVWDQRVCLVPDADLFQALLTDRAAVVTDQIERFTRDGVLLASGEMLKADLIVTATGIEIQLLGGCEIEVDGRRVDLTESMIYKGCMLSGVPNLCNFFGYSNASWTLKVDMSARWVCRLLEHMDKHGIARSTPQKDPSIAEEPLLQLSSGYVARAAQRLPKGGSKWPYKNCQNYIVDYLLLHSSRLDDGTLELTPHA
jgi:monooxygenase